MRFTEKEERYLREKEVWKVGPTKSMEKALYKANLDPERLANVNAENHMKLGNLDKYVNWLQKQNNKKK